MDHRKFIHEAGVYYMDIQQPPKFPNSPRQVTSSVPASSGLSTNVFFAIILLAGAFWAYERLAMTAQELQGNGGNPVARAPQESSEFSTYQNEDVTFKFPISWIQKPILIRGSGFTQDFEDSNGKYAFTFSGTGNYSQITGHPYVTIDEFIDMPYAVPLVIIDGQEGIQALPRAGSENINRVVFFSKDLKFIYTLELKTGDTPLNTSQSDIEEGQKVFNQILSTFKFF